VCHLLSLHDALPISSYRPVDSGFKHIPACGNSSAQDNHLRVKNITDIGNAAAKHIAHTVDGINTDSVTILRCINNLFSVPFTVRSEEHTSELQSRFD